jgi:hypothetical protein
VSPRLALALATALALAPAAAQAESPISGSFEFQAGPYRPNIDSEFTAGTNTPYADAFGSSRPWAFSIHAARALTRSFGTVEVGIGAGYFNASGHGRFSAAAGAGLAGTSATDTTYLRVIPTRLTLTWRADLVAERFGIPLVPFLRGSLERANWWVVGPTGSTSKTGATNGYSYGGGLALQLDFFDPTLARELDADSGINHTYVVAEVRKTKIDDFGSTSSWNMSDGQATFTFGLMFIF